MIEVAGRMAAERLRLSAFARIYAGSAVALMLALLYLAVSAEATQSAYALSQLKDRNAQLIAEQDQLRYQSASLHGPSRIEQEAAATGLQRSTAVIYVSARPAQIDLGRPIGPGRPSSGPFWQRAVAVISGSHDATAAGSS
jgi:hypothetical protein